MISGVRVACFYMHARRVGTVNLDAEEHQNRETAPTTEVSPEASDPALESSYTNEPSSADPDSSRVVDQEEQTEYAKARPKRIIKAPDVYGRDTLYS